VISDEMLEALINKYSQFANTEMRDALEELQRRRQNDGTRHGCLILMAYFLVAVASIYFLFFAPL
jgi:hypothetical protein